MDVWQVSDDAIHDTNSVQYHCETVQLSFEYYLANLFEMSHQSSNSTMLAYCCKFFEYVVYAAFIRSSSTSLVVDQ